jgi:hypothetical protein
MKSMKPMSEVLRSPRFFREVSILLFGFAAVTTLITILLFGSGSSEASYWVYALISGGDINGDGRTDLVFYSGDDESDETVTLINRGDRFLVNSRKHHNELDNWQVYP